MRSDPHGATYETRLTSGCSSPLVSATYTKDSLIDLMTWDAEDRIGLITCPLLTVAGTSTDSRYMNEDTFTKVTRNDDCAGAHKL